MKVFKEKYKGLDDVTLYSCDIANGDHYTSSPVLACGGRWMFLDNLEENAFGSFFDDNGHCPSDSDELDRYIRDMDSCYSVQADIKANGYDAEEFYGVEGVLAYDQFVEYDGMAVLLDELEEKLEEECDTELDHYPDGEEFYRYVRNHPLRVKEMITRFIKGEGVANEE